jgi:Putative cyclase
MDSLRHMRDDAPGPEGIPLEYCYGDGVCLDFRHLPKGTGISVNEVKQALSKIHYTLKPLDIVLIHTGAGKIQELGLIEPFVKEKGWTFPVLPAYGFINKLLDGVSIPRNWILDAEGKWQWEQIGYNSMEADWEGTMLAKIESVKKGL